MTMKEKITYQVEQHTRRDWGLVKPFTRIEESKKNKKPKHKKRDMEQAYE